MVSLEEIQKTVGVLIEIGDQLKDRAAYVTMALGLVMSISALFMIGALMTDEWSPSLGLGLGLVIALLATASIVLLSGLLVSAWVYRLTNDVARRNDELYTERDKANTEVQRLHQEVELVRAQTEFERVKSPVRTGP